MRRIFYYWLPFAFAMIATLYLSIMPGINTSGWFPHSDTVGHILLYFLLNILSIRLFRFESGKNRIYHYMIISILIAVFGALNEYQQKFISGRTFEIADIVANITGILLGAVAYYIYNLRSQRALGRENE